MSAQLAQGTTLLKLRTKRNKMLIPGLNIIDGINNSLGSVTAYTNDYKPRYAYCPKNRNYLNIKESFKNPQRISYCQNAPGLPNYGYCPPGTYILKWEKDDDPTQREAQMNKFNRQLSQYGTLYKNYMEEVNKYIADPPTGNLGQNIQVSQLTGAASPLPR